MVPKKQNRPTDNFLTNAIKSTSGSQPTTESMNQQQFVKILVLKNFVQRWNYKDAVSAQHHMTMIQ